MAQKDSCRWESSHGLPLKVLSRLRRQVEQALEPIVGERSAGAQPEPPRPIALWTSVGAPLRSPQTRPALNVSKAESLRNARHRHDIHRQSLLSSIDDAPLPAWDSLPPGP